MEKTLFQKIADREIPADFVYEDEQVFAILDINPVNIGHTLVIPKNPWQNIYEIPGADFGYLMQVAQKIAQKIKTELSADGINIIMNNESSAGQIIFHAHVHVIPRYKGDGHLHWKGSRSYNDGEQSEIVSKIKI